MKYLPIFLIVVSLLVSCDNHSRHWDTLSRVEMLIEEHPDSALITLQELNASELRGDEERARYALLLSMALDKNLIDKTDFEVIRPAVEYYGDNGTPTERLRMNYYHGRIYQNRGNEAAAMNCYLEAMEQGEESDDVLTKARLLVAQGNVYSSLMKWDKASEVNLQAAKYFYNMDRLDSYVNCLLKASIGYIQRCDYDNAKVYIEQCYSYWNEVSDEIRGDICAIHLTYLVAVDDKKGIDATIDACLNDVPPCAINKVALASAYSHVGKYEMAKQAISEIDKFNDVGQELTYYATLTQLYQETADYKNALDCYVKFNELNDAILFNVFEQDAQFAEERYVLKEQTVEEREAKNYIIIICITLSILFVFIIIHIQYFGKNLPH